jgi:hypothetical protein
MASQKPEQGFEKTEIDNRSIVDFYALFFPLGIRLFIIIANFFSSMGIVSTILKGKVRQVFSSQKQL